MKQDFFKSTLSYKAMYSLEFERIKMDSSFDGNIATENVKKRK